MAFNDGPKVFLVAKTQLQDPELLGYLREVGGEGWWHRNEFGPDAEWLTEFAGRLCYRSWEPGLNPNVTKVRADRTEYLKNILKQGHGSVLEHVTYSFVFHQVSRIFTHELVRHRAGTAMSQESMRYVRLDDIPFWMPEWAQDEELTKNAGDLLARMSWFQKWMADHLDIDSLPFHKKKHYTSFMRRFAPDGLSTGILWTANVRTLRHVIEARTATGAEEEMRLVFGKVAEIMKQEAPALFGDFRETGDGWVPEWSKV